MTNIKLKMSKGEDNVELEMVDYDQHVLKYVVDKLSNIFGEKEEEIAPEVKSEDPLAPWREGYQALAKEEKGLHDPGTEFTVNENSEVQAAVKEAAASLEESASSSETEPADFNRQSNFGKKQLYYICECGNRGKHFISPKRSFVTCHSCDNKMKVRLADPRGCDFRDDHGNHFIAGEYKKTMKDKEEEAQFWEEQRISGF